jgi:hypothetical protein
MMSFRVKSKLRRTRRTDEARMIFQGQNSAQETQIKRRFRRALSIAAGPARA